MDIILKIKSLFQKEGTDQATTEVDKLSTSTAKVTQNSNAAAKASVGASQGFAAAGQAASAASSGGIGPLTASMGGMLQLMPKLARFAGPAGLLIAGAVAWYKAINAVSEAKKKLKEQIESIRFENIESSIKSTTEQYALQRKEIDRNYESAKRLSDFQQSKDDALTAQKLAELELETERVKALDPENEFHVRRTDNAAAKSRAGILAEAEDRRYRQQDQARTTDREHYTGVKADAAAQIVDYESDIARINKEESAARELARLEKESKKTLGSFMPGMLDKIDKKLAEQLDKLGENRKAAYEGIATQIDVSKDADEALRNIVYEAAMAAIQKGTANVQQQTTAEKTKSSGSAIVRDQQKADDEKRRQLIDDQIDRLKSEAANRVKNSEWKAEQFDAADFKHADQGTRQQARVKDKRLDQQAAYVKQLQQQLADAEASADAIPLEKFGQSISSIKAKLNRLENAFQNLPNN